MLPVVPNLSQVIDPEANDKAGPTYIPWHLVLNKPNNYVSVLTDLGFL